MRIRKYLMACVVLAAFPAGAGAQEAGQPMTLKECMEYAVSNSTKVRIQQAEIGDAQIARRNAVLRAFTPSISGNAYAYYNFGRSIDPETNTYVTETSFHNGYSVGAGFTLFDGFSAVNNLKISRTALAIGQTQEKQVEADICLAVMEAYYNVVYYKRLCDIYETQLATAQSSLIRLRRQEELGQKSHADVVQAEADLADRQYDAITIRNAFDDQKAKLADLMFWPVERELLVETETASFDDARASEETDAVVAFALSFDPGVKIAGWNVDNARRELATARWQLLPRLNVNAGWSTSYFDYPGKETRLDSFRDQLRNHQGQYLQLSMSIPIYDRLQGYDNIARKRNALKKVTAQYDQKRRDVESEVRRAVRDCEGAAAAYLQARKKAAVQEEAYQLNVKKMEQGMISPIEYQTATNNYLKSQADELDALFKYLIRQSVVRYYNGTEYINQ